MHNVSKGPFKVIGGELVGKGDAPIAAFMTGFVGSAKGIFTTSEENQKDNAKLGLDAFRTFRSTKSLPSELARSLADAQAEIASLRGALEACQMYALEFPDSLLRDNLLDTAADALK